MKHDQLIKKSFYVRTSHAKKLEIESKNQSKGRKLKVSESAIVRDIFDNKYQLA